MLPLKKLFPHHTLDSEVFVSVSYAVGGSGGPGESNNYLIFGTGTKLYVSASRKPQKPEVSLYSAEPQQGKQPLLCVASGMFPPEIRFSWRRKKDQGKEEELPATEQLELKQPGRVSSIRVVDLDPLHAYTYTCSVQHERDVPTQPSKVVRSGPPPPPPRPTAPPSEPRWYRERLVCLLYSALIAKSLLYFCGLSLFSICGTKRASCDD